MRKLLAGIGILLSLLVGDLQAQSYVLTGRNAFADTLILNSMRVNNPSTTADSLDIFRRIDNIPGVRLDNYSTTLSDSSFSSQNGQDFKRALKYASSIRSSLILPNDTTYIDTLAFENLSGITILGSGNSVLAYRDSVKSNQTNIMLKFTGCRNVIIDRVIFDGNMGSGSGSGYDNAVIPIYFEGGGALGENEHILINRCRFDDSWWIGFGGAVSGGNIASIGDTVARHIEISNNLWDRIAKRGPAENLGHNGISSSGIIQYVKIHGNTRFNKVDGVVYGNGIYLLPGIIDGEIYNNKSYNGYDSDYYSRGRRLRIYNNLSVDVGKDNFKNIYLDAPLDTVPGWTDVGEVYFYNNRAVGSGRRILGSPVFFNFEGDGNFIAYNLGEAQDTTGYLVDQGQVGIRIGRHSKRNDIIGNILMGYNSVYDGFPGEDGILLVDTLGTIEADRTNIEKNLVEGFRRGILIQLDTKFPRIVDNTIIADSICIEDFGPNNQKITIFKNYLSSDDFIFSFSNPVGADSILILNNVYDGYTSIYRTSEPSPADTLIDTLNVGIQ